MSVNHCPNCANPLTVNYGESIINDRLLWSVLHYCENCDYAEELGGYDNIPDEYRKKIINDDGLWSLRVDDLNDNPSQGLYAIKNVMGLSLTEIYDIKQNIPTNIATGTKTEMTYYQNQLKMLCEQLIVELYQQNEN